MKNFFSVRSMGLTALNSTHLKIWICLVEPGIEPTVFRFQVLCSTQWTIRAI